jgi:polar amino acid transport system substrate-binding protein/glutamate/aspartate transport system substrate-binding protein
MGKTGEIMSSFSRTLGALTLASTVWFAGEAPGQTPAPTLVPAATSTPTSTPTPTIDQIRSSKTLRIAYDADAPPFSYIAPGSPATAAPQGYSVDLCRAVADQFKEQLKIPDLKVAYVAVNSVSRFDVIVDNKADLLCESSTATLSRRTKVDFSIPIFIDGASFAIGPNGPRDVKQLAGKKVAVLPGTTTEQELRRALTGTHIDAELVLVKTNQEGIDLLVKGQVAAYFADRATLTFLLRKEKEAASLLMADTYLSIEPIALAVRRGDGDFRLAVDTALSHIYRRGEIVTIFKGAFGPLTTPSPLLNALFQISGLPD